MVGSIIIVNSHWRNKNDTRPDKKWLNTASFKVQNRYPDLSGKITIVILTQDRYQRFENIILTYHFPEDISHILFTIVEEFLSIFWFRVEGNNYCRCKLFAPFQVPEFSLSSGLWCFAGGQLGSVHVHGKWRSVCGETGSRWGGSGTPHSTPAPLQCQCQCQCQCHGQHPLQSHRGHGPANSMRGHLHLVSRGSSGLSPQSLAGILSRTGPALYQLLGWNMEWKTFEPSL